MRRLTQEEFIARAIAVHGDRYGYEKAVYVNNRTKVSIYCKHCKKYFEQKPREHLYGKGCKDCGFERTLAFHKGRPSINNRKIKYGVGINDYKGSVVDENGKTIPSYETWSSMFKRCYSDSYQAREPSYIGCFVCEDWWRFSNFKKWFDDNSNGYKTGYELDKDILVKNNKMYGPETCCFVPKRINSLLLKPFKYKNGLPTGVSRAKKRYIASCACVGEKIYIGRHDTAEEAFAAYKKVKESYIKQIATKYYNEGAITEKVYKALLNYKIEITD